MNLKRLLRPPPGDLWMDVALWLAASVFGVWLVAKYGVLTRGGLPSQQLLLIPLALVIAAGYWFCQWWVRWLVIGTAATLSIDAILRAAVQRELTITQAVMLGLCAYGIWYVWHEDIPPRDEEAPGDDDEKPLVSLVLLQRELPYLEASIIARLASQAWDADIRGGSGDDDAEDEADAVDDEDKGDGFVVGEDRLYMMMYGPGMFLVHNVDAPYFDDIDAVVEGCRELRTRSAVAEHRAWTAIDLLRLDSDSPAIEQQAYRLIGRFLAELADETQSLAVFDPASGAIHPFDPETEQKLRSDDPLTALREWFYAPIVRVEQGELEAAVAEAQARWPEFVAAFEQRDAKNESSFIIKAPFGDDDNVEFMWVEVTALEGDTVFGILKNEPHAVPGLHEGDRVRVAQADINDWLGIIDGAPLGGFTLKALGDKMRSGDSPDE